jgi:hypothetical protein
VSNPFGPVQRDRARATLDKWIAAKTATQHKFQVIRTSDEVIVRGAHTLEAGVAQNHDSRVEMAAAALNRPDERDLELRMAKYLDWSDADLVPPLKRLAQVVRHRVRVDHVKKRFWHIVDTMLDAIRERRTK